MRTLPRDGGLVNVKYYLSDDGNLASGTELDNGAGRVRFEFGAP